VYWGGGKICSNRSNRDTQRGNKDLGKGQRKDASARGEKNRMWVLVSYKKWGEERRPVVSGVVATAVIGVVWVRVETKKKSFFSLIFRGMPSGSKKRKLQSG